MKAALVFSENIRALLDRQHKTQHALAMWCDASDAWLSAILANRREVQLADLDRIADFFGLAAYQLFQPGISTLYERRRGERRTGRERRRSDQEKAVVALANQIDAHRPLGGKGRLHVAAASPHAEALSRVVDRLAAEAQRILSQAELRGQTGGPRRPQSSSRAGRGTPGRQLPKKA